MTKELKKIAAAIFGAFIDIHFMSSASSGFSAVSDQQRYNDR
jgi:hypothetical protein